MRQFVAVAEELHFSRAAKRLFMAQPPLSQSIKRIEAELQVELFDRSRRGVRLTKAGEVLLEEARRTLQQAELAVTATKRVAATEQARINVSLIGPALYRLLPLVLLQHHQAFPSVEIKLFERSSPAQIEGLMKGSFEAAFLHPSVDLPEGGDKLVVERCSFVAAIPSDWPIAACKSVSLANLGALPFIATPHNESPSRVAQMMSAFRSAGVLPNVAQQAMQTNTVLGLVAASIGYAIVPATAALTGWRNITFLPLEGFPETMRWELAMVWWPEHISPSTRRFVNLVTKFVADHAELLDVNASIL